MRLAPCKHTDQKHHVAPELLNRTIRKNTHDESVSYLMPLVVLCNGKKVQWPTTLPGTLPDCLGPFEPTRSNPKQGFWPPHTRTVLITYWHHLLQTGVRGTWAGMQVMLLHALHTSLGLNSFLFNRNPSTHEKLAALTYEI